MADNKTNMQNLKSGFFSPEQKSNDDLLTMLYQLDKRNAGINVNKFKAVLQMLVEAANSDLASLVMAAHDTSFTGENLPNMNKQYRLYSQYLLSIITKDTSGTYLGQLAAFHDKDIILQKFDSTQDLERLLTARRHSMRNR